MADQAVAAQLSWSWFGHDELQLLQERMGLMPLLTLRTTSKAVRADLDANAPPEVTLARWIIDQKIVNLGAAYNKDLPGYDEHNGHKAWAKAHRKMRTKQPCILKAHTQLLVSVYKLLEGMAMQMGGDTTHSKRFSDLWRPALTVELGRRFDNVVEGLGTGMPYNPTPEELLREPIYQDPTAGYVFATPPTAKESMEKYGPPVLLSSDESVALVAVMNCGAVKASGSLFLYVAEEGNLPVLRYLAGRGDIDVHWRTRGPF